MAEQDMQRIGMVEDDLEMQESRAKRSDQAAAFASWLNSMRMKPDANLPAQLQAAQERRASNIRKNRTVNMLESAGQTELAKQVKSGAITGKTAVAQMFQLAAEERQAQRAAAARGASERAAELAFERQKEMELFKAGLRGPELTAAMREYKLAQQDPQFAEFMKLKEPPETPAGLKKLDEQFATTLSGTSAQALAAARQDAAAISSVLKQLEGGAQLTGPIIGSIPENLRAILNPESVQAQQLVESVVQKNLRAILGGQFAQKEGEQLVRRAYNPLLPEEQNAARLRALLLSLDTAAQNKQAMEDYFYKNNYSLRGYSGPMGIPSMDEFEAAMEAAAPSPKGSVPTAPSVGTVEDGYRFKGGDPSDPNNWEKI